MSIKEILSRCDHTLLSPTATFEDIKTLCDEGIEFGCASVCIPPAFVDFAKEYVGDRLKICTVIGFPLGYSTAAVKAAEAADAIARGADEIDMVINLGYLKSGKAELLLDEIKAVKTSVGDKILKVIIETCLLTEEEKLLMCRIVTEAGADFIKTSTGFSTGGAKADDVRLLKENVGPEIRVKAAGGISSLADAKLFIALGADRLGTSRIVKLARQQGTDSSGYGY